MELIYCIAQNFQEENFHRLVYFWHVMVKFSCLSQIAFYGPVQPHSGVWQWMIYGENIVDLSHPQQFSPSNTFHYTVYLSKDIIHIQQCTWSRGCVRGEAVNESRPFDEYSSANSWAKHEPSPPNPPSQSTRRWNPCKLSHSSTKKWILDSKESRNCACACICKCLRLSLLIFQITQLMDASTHASETLPIKFQY